MIRIGYCFIVAALAGGCTATTYRPYDQREAATPLLERRVYAHVSAEIASDLPRCVMIVPADPGLDQSITSRVTGSLRRHLVDHFERVIGSEEAERAAGGMAYEGAGEQEQRALATGMACDSVLRWRVLDGSGRFALIWADQRFGLEVELVRSRDGLALWQASHLGNRWAGGAPLSWLALPIAVAQATQLHNDDDGFTSLIEDVVRRMTATLSVVASK